MAEVLRGADIRVGYGETVGLIGRNGAGKTTLLMCLAGLLRCKADSIRICGFEPRAVEARRAIGFIPERLSGSGAMTAAEFLSYLGALSDIDGPALRERIDALLTRFELEDVRGRKLRTFSRGMMQRLTLCQALLHNPRVLLADEPTSALDPPGIELFHSLLEDEKRRGTSFLLSSHQLGDVQQYCDRTYLLEEGQLREVTGTVSAKAVFVQ